jgi:nucleotide-binding universal stress UspA family protein
MKKIVVPIDFSEESLNGLDLAIKVANHMKAEIQMVHVIKDSNEVFSASEVEHRKEAESSFKEIVESHKDMLKDGNSLSYKLLKGRIHQEVVNHAKYNDADMIIGSTHGASGFEEFFIGSNAHRILASSELPTMVIRNGIAPRSFDRIILPIDNTIETRQKVPFTAELAKSFDAEITVLAIAHYTDATTKNKVKAYREQVTDYLDKEEIKYDVKEVTGSIVRNILDCARECDADLISVMAEEELTLSAYVLGTNVMELTRKANLPLLCIHQRDIYRLSDIFRQQP